MSSDRGDGFCLCHPDNFPSHITTQPLGTSAGPVSVIPLFACHYPLDRCLQQVLCGRHQSWSLNVASDSASTPWLVLGRGAPWAIPFMSVIPRWLTSGMSWHSSVGDFWGVVGSCTTHSHAQLHGVCRARAEDTPEWCRSDPRQPPGVLGES